MWVTSGLYVSHIQIVLWVSGSSGSIGVTHFQLWLTVVFRESSFCTWHIGLVNRASITARYVNVGPLHAHWLVSWFKITAKRQMLVHHILHNCKSTPPCHVVYICFSLIIVRNRVITVLKEWPEFLHKALLSATWANNTAKSKYVTVWAKTRHVRTQTEIHFIAPAYSYTK